VPVAVDAGLYPTEAVVNQGRGVVFGGR
jgi:hypothetical protein